MKILIALLTLVTLFAPASNLQAAVPQLINFQGRLTDSGGTPLNGSFSVLFEIYPQAVGGAALWSETQNVTVTDGIFNILLGSGIPITDGLFIDDDRYLSVKVGTDPAISPRNRLVTSPYSYRVATIDSAKGGVITSATRVLGDLTTGTSLNSVNSLTVDGPCATIAGGRNHVDGRGTVIAGGTQDTTRSGVWSAIIGGVGNTIDTSQQSVIVGGADNRIRGIASVICGGSQNEIFESNSSVYGFIGGGQFQSASGNNNAVLGGRGNEADGAFNVILGGLGNQSTAACSSSAAVACRGCSIENNFALAVGDSVRITVASRAYFFDGDHPGRFALNRDSEDGGASFPIHVGTSSTNGNGARLTIGGVWTDASSRTFKENFVEIGGSELLEKISRLDTPHYNYKGTAEKHIGPMAEDFAALFDVGSVDETTGQIDPMYLSAKDVAGVSLAGVKELIIKNGKLENRVAELERLVQSLIDTKK